MENIKVLPTLGIIGGTGWPSTNIYFDEIPRRVQKELGGLNSPNITFMSRNFAQIDAWMHEGNWAAVQGCLTEMALQMKRGGRIDALAILSNTLHKVAREVAMVADVPLIHIGDCAAKLTWGQGLDRVGFIGTKFTMQEDFILQHFRDQGIEVFTPEASAMQRIDDIIFGELCSNQYAKEDLSRRFLFQQVAEMISRHHIEGVVLGCTELGLTMTTEHWAQFCEQERIAAVNLPFIDTTMCHIEAIVAFCCHEA